MLYSYYARNVRFDKDAVEIDLPGTGRDNIKVDMTPDADILIKIKGKDDTERTLRLDAEGFIDATASYKDGVLRIERVRDKAREAKQIKVA